MDYVLLTLAPWRWHHLPLVPVAVEAMRFGLVCTYNHKAASELLLCVVVDVLSGFPCFTEINQVLSDQVWVLFYVLCMFLIELLLVLLGIVGFGLLARARRRFRGRFWVGVLFHVEGKRLADVPGTAAFLSILVDQLGQGLRRYCRGVDVQQNGWRCGSIAEVLDAITKLASPPILRNAGALSNRGIDFQRAWGQGEAVGFLVEVIGSRAEVSGHRQMPCIAGGGVELELVEVVEAEELVLVDGERRRRGEGDVVRAERFERLGIAFLLDCRG